MSRFICFLFCLLWVVAASGAEQNIYLEEESYWLGEMEASTQDDELIYNSATFALNQGQIEEAIRLFELVIRLNPNHAGAQLDLGRAYFHAGRYADARRELVEVKAKNPPPEAMMVIEQYLSEIDQLESVTMKERHAYIQVGIGRDSNINSAVGLSEINVPVFGNIPLTLNPNNRQMADNYLTSAIGADGTHTLGNDFLGYWSGSFANRNNLHHGEMDGFGPELAGGMIWGRERYFLRGGLAYSRYYLAGKRNRDVYSINVDANYQVTQQDRIGVFGQYGEYRFRDIVPSSPAVLPNENFSQVMIGAVWAHSFGEGRDISVLGYSGREISPTRADGSNSFVGARASWDEKLSDLWRLSLTAGYKVSNFESMNGMFLLYRKDNQPDVSAGLDCDLDKDWQLKFQWSRSRMSSSIPLNSFQREDISVLARRNF